MGDPFWHAPAPLLAEWCAEHGHPHEEPPADTCPVCGERLTEGETDGR